jgi:hypothetical protein
MDDKNGEVNIKIEINNINHKSDISLLVEKKIDFFYDVIQKTIIHVQKNKSLDILGINDVSTCIDKLNEINIKVKDISENIKTSQNTELLINELQLINNDLSTLLKNYGTEKLDDLITICFGINNKIATNENETLKLNLLKKYFHPTSYKVINKKEEQKNKNKKGEFLPSEKINNIDCSDISTLVKQFHLKVYGIKLCVNSIDLKKCLIIYGFIDDIVIDYLNSKYILSKRNELIVNKNIEENFNENSYKNYVDSLTLKDYLINNNINDFNSKYAGIMSQVNSIKQKQISNVVKEFILDNTFSKRNTLMNLLINSDNCENQYLSYLLYDLLTNDTNGTIDTQEQTILYDSFPWTIKNHFKNSMKKTIQYTNELSNFDINKIPLEQQICLLKAPDTVKEKAMIKLKEVKAKSEDTGTKARQYLDGLLRIPFGVYRKEPILTVMKNVRIQFKELCKRYNLNNIYEEILIKDNYTNIEVINCIKKIKNTIEYKETDFLYENVKNYLLIGDNPRLHENIILINETLKNNKSKYKRIKHTGLKKEELKEKIETFIDNCKKDEEKIIKDLYILLKPHFKENKIIDFSEINK